MLPTTSSRPGADFHTPIAWDSMGYIIPTTMPMLFWDRVVVKACKTSVSVVFWVWTWSRSSTFGLFWWDLMWAPSEWIWTVQHVAENLQFGSSPAPPPSCWLKSKSLIWHVLWIEPAEIVWETIVSILGFQPSVELGWIWCVGCWNGQVDVTRPLNPSLHCNALPSVKPGDLVQSKTWRKEKLTDFL